jgi:hypothetical protein
LWFAGGLAAVPVRVAIDEEACAAEDGAALRRVERDGRLLAALRALHGDFDALSHPCGLCGGDGSQPLVLGLLAGLATLRLVPQTLVVKEELFTSRPDEILTAINAEYRSILKLYLHLIPLRVSLRRRNLYCLNL